MSGSATAAWAVNRDPLSLAKQLAVSLGCNKTTTAEQIYNCVTNSCPFQMANNALQFNVSHLSMLQLSS